MKIGASIANDSREPIRANSYYWSLLCFSTVLASTCDCLVLARAKPSMPHIVFRSAFARHPQLSGTSLFGSDFIGEVLRDWLHDAIPEANVCFMCPQR